VRLETLVRRALEGGGDDWEDVEVDVDLSNAPALIHGDPDLLLRALTNVISNARQALGALVADFPESEYTERARKRMRDLPPPPASQIPPS